jgi:hypothetical protein
MDSRDEVKTERRDWFGRLHLSWPMLFLAGWLLYEFTSQPGLAALVACDKFGWTDLRTAVWLRRVDPDRWRGQTCFWAYLTYGLWKVAVMATLTIIVLGFLSAVLDRAPRQPQPNNDFSAVLGGALAAAAAGFGLSFPTTYIALWSARRNGVRVWLGKAPNRARKERFWPPHHGGVNAAPFVGFTCMVLTVWFTTLVAVSVIMKMQPGGLGIVVFVATTITSLIFIVLGLYRASLQVIARSPHECWGAEEGEAAYQVPSAEEGVGKA